MPKFVIAIVYGVAIAFALYAAGFTDAYLWAGPIEVPNAFVVALFSALAVFFPETGLKFAVLVLFVAVGIFLCRDILGEMLRNQGEYDLAWAIERQRFAFVSLAVVAALPLTLPYFSRALVRTVGS